MQWCAETIFISDAETSFIPNCCFLSNQHTFYLEDVFQNYLLFMYRLIQKYVDIPLQNRITLFQITTSLFHLFVFKNFYSFVGNY